MQDPTEFEAERGHLTAVAYRMLGSRAEAEDAVQETWLRYAAALGRPEDRARVRDLRGWLTTTIGRICLDVLRSARVRRETYPGQWLPEPVVTRLPDHQPDRGGGFAPDPADRAVTTDQVGLAMLVLLERLTPEQRVALVLHDVFAMPFADVASVLRTTEAAARQHASRARRAVSGADVPRHTAHPEEQHRAVAAFLAAAHSGDLDRLVAVLAPGATFLGDGGGYVSANRRPVTGALRVARFTVGLWHHRGAAEMTSLRGRAVLVNGALGVQVEGVLADGRPARAVLSFAVGEDGRIGAVFMQLNPVKLSRVPTLPEGDGDWPPRL
ncbi:RNA polymerase sigma factor SigJ [Plantactinospora sp. GCM10030261]|uniref:RNA polymerase sigma factor SigJ n=1 Tax=Plantactinospora sp. GCM10030261 TaxID=3273420 RepID=UPI0036104C4F